MRIEKLRIGHFGKFSNETLTFTEGINVVRGSNETGKSTIHAFIRAMLFGMDKPRGRAGREDPYSRYQPWDTPGAYQGSMDIEHEGQRYRITRVFYQKEKSCTVTDPDTGRRIETADDRITSLIPELTAAAYGNTVSAGQLKTRPEAGLADEVSNYMANLTASGDRDIDVAAALDRLKDRKKELAGRLEALNCEGLEKERDNLLESEQDLMVLSADREEAEKRLQSAEAERERLSLLLAGKREERDRLQSEFREKSRTAADALTAAENRCRERAEEKTAAYSEADAKSRKYRSRSFTALGTAAALLIIAALCSQSFTAGVWIGVAAAAVLLAAFMLWLIKSEENKRLGDSLREDSSAELEELRQEVVRCRAESSRKQEELMTGLDGSERECRETEEELRAAEKDAADRKGSLERICWEMEGLGDIGADIDSNKQALKAAYEQRDRLNLELDAVRTAVSEIEELTLNIHESFGPRLNRLLSEEAACLTDGRYTEVRVNRSLGLEIMTGLDFVPAEALSAGTAEQLYLALRLAVSELFFENTEMPLLLDECFAFYDDDRLRSTLAALMSRDKGQLIIFTCSDREERMLDSLGAVYNRVELK